MADSRLSNNDWDCGLSTKQDQKYSTVRSPVLYIKDCVALVLIKVGSYMSLRNYMAFSSAATPFITSNINQIILTQNQVQYPAPHNSQARSLDVRRQTSDTHHQAPGTRHQAPDTRHQSRIVAYNHLWVVEVEAGFKGGWIFHERNPS